MLSLFQVLHSGFTIAAARDNCANSVLPFTRQLPVHNKSEACQILVERRSSTAFAYSPRIGRVLRSHTPYGLFVNAVSTLTYEQTMTRLCSAYDEQCGMNLKNEAQGYTRHALISITMIHDLTSYEMREVKMRAIFRNAMTLTALAVGMTCACFGAVSYT